MPDFLISMVVVLPENLQVMDASNPLVKLYRTMLLIVIYLPGYSYRDGGQFIRTS
ncbi:MAG: hypothetical protein IPO25_19770 [Saprospiraceae bacterium]|nr:hypothetical protein [Saprospiraceae bacterium]